MQTLTLKVADESNLLFLVELLHKLDFVTDIKVQKPQKRAQQTSNQIVEKDIYAQLKEKYKHLPIQWSDNEPQGDELFGIWKDNPRTLEQIREKAWKRK